MLKLVEIGANIVISVLKWGYYRHIWADLPHKHPGIVISTQAYKKLKISYNIVA